MKRILLILTLITQFAFSQVNTTTTTAGKYKMNIPDPGAKKDSIVVWDGTSKLLKIRPVSQITGATNLDQLVAPTGISIFSSTGTDIVLPLATNSNAGLLAPAEKTKLANISGTNTGDQDLSGLATNTAMTTALGNKVDKVTGKSLLSDTEITRLGTLANYTHPANHPASIITQDASNRFVTDAEKTAWNAKQNTLVSGTSIKTIETQTLLGSGNIDLSKTDVGLANVDNTADTAKPISTATQTALNAKQDLSAKGVANGYAGLDASGKVPLTQINDALLGSVNYQGTYNAATNTPALPTVSTSNKGYYYVISTAGTQAGLSLNAGDWIISNGTAWGKIDNNNAVTAVNNATGNVILTTSNITEGTNLYYTDARVNANASVAASATARHNAVTIGTANGLSLSTQQLSLGLASTSTTGALSSTDWNTFKGKFNTPTGLTANFLPKWSGSGFGNSNVSDDGSVVFVSSNFTIKNPVSTVGLEFFTAIPNRGILSYDRTNSTYQDFTLRVKDFIISNSDSDKFVFKNRGALLVNTTTDNGVDQVQVNGSGSFSGKVSSERYESVNGYFLPTTGGGYSNSIKTVNDFSLELYVGRGSTTRVEMGSADIGFDTFSQRRLTIKDNGNVNIGNPLTPVEKFNVAGLLMSIDAKNQYLRMGMDSDVAVISTDWYSGFGGSSRPLEFRTGGITRLQINHGGFITISGNLITTGNVTAPAFFQSSDRRLKTILKRDGDVAYFKWKDKRDIKTHIGYIAQEVKKEFPNQVQKDEKGMLSVNYIEVLVAKVQALEKRIQELEQKK